ncbi:MAG: hypothetical protein EA390_01265 [Balneolaceae bacterium]|nr:MAG: hypothetical protein EA390_01265 [Balneolaceae bacterium]
MKKYKPIPIPWKQRFRELRVRVLPIIVFLSVTLGVYFLWDERVQSPGMIGEVVADKAIISSPERGLLTRFTAEQFDDVLAGDLLGEVIIADPERVQAQMNVILGEIELIRQSLDPVIDEERNRLNRQGLNVDLMEQRIALAEARLNYRQSLADFNRTVRLFDQGLASDQDFELAQLELDTNKVRVEQIEQLVEELEESLKVSRSFGGFTTLTERDPVEASIQLQNRKLEALEKELQPRQIYSPKSGVVSRVFHRTGEFVEAGSIILEVEERRPSYIVGYVRQPFTVEPEVGMQVEIRTRKPGRDFVMSHITKLGGHFTLIDAHLQRPGSIYESGLPVRISLAENDEIHFTPGEIVDIVMHAN